VGLASPTTFVFPEEPNENTIPALVEGLAIHERVIMGIENVVAMNPGQLPAGWVVSSELPLTSVKLALPPELDHFVVDEWFLYSQSA